MARLEDDLLLSFYRRVLRDTRYVHVIETGDPAEGGNVPNCFAKKSSVSLSIVLTTAPEAKAEGSTYNNGSHQYDNITDV